VVAFYGIKIRGCVIRWRVRGFIVLIFSAGGLAA